MQEKRRKPGILIVEDNEINAEVLGAYLAEVDYDVAIEESGENALTAVKSVEFDLILLDIMLPGMSGYELCVELKNNRVTKDIPIIFISALADTVDKVRGFKAGAVDYITKPIQREEVLNRVHTHLTLRQQQRALQEEITVRLHAEQQLKEINELLEEKVRKRTRQLSIAHRIAKLGGWTFDIEYGRLHCSREMCEVLGISEDRADWTIQKLIERCAPSGRVKLDRLLTPDYLEGEVRSGQVELTPNGEEPLIINWIARADTGPPQKQISGTVQDLTERVRAERKVQESAELLQTMIDSFPESVLLVDETGVVLTGNEKIAQRAGTTIERLKGSNLFDQGSSVFPAVTTGDLAAVRRSAYPLKKEVRLNGQVMALIIQPVFDREEHLSSFVLLGIDITDSIRDKEEIRNSHEKLQALAVHLQDVREEERASISREIHDVLGQALTALKIDISSLEHELGNYTAGILQKIKKMVKLADTTIQTVKRISTELRPGILDDLGLASAIEWQADDFSSRTGIGVDVSLEPEEVFLDDARSIALFRIFQETLTNITRHAKANHVIVELRLTGSEVRLRVTDDGVGFNPAELDTKSSLGLIGMRERVRPWDGNVEFTSGPQGGAVVSVTIPVIKKKAVHESNDSR